jgi:hypothetical protein
MHLQLAYRAAVAACWRWEEIVKEQEVEIYYFYVRAKVP